DHRRLPRPPRHHRHSAIHQDRPGAVTRRGRGCRGGALMTSGEPRPGCDRADAERVWGEYLSATAGESWQRRPQNRHVVEQFLTGLCADDPSGRQRLVIDEPRVRDWMIRDVVGQSPASAAERLAVLDRFLRVLVEAGQIETHPLTGYRTGHHLRSWQSLVRALQAEDPRAALAAL